MSLIQFGRTQGVLPRQRPVGELCHRCIGNIFCCNHRPRCPFLLLAASKRQRCSKHRHRQLLSTISSAIVPGPPADRPSESRSAGVHPSESAKWVRTPSGWASVPSPYLPPVPGPVVQLPFLQFPPVSYDGSTLERGGYPAYPFPRVDLGGEAVSYHRRPALQQPSAPSRFVKINNQEPVARRTRSRRLTATVATTTVRSVSRSSSRTRFSNVPSETESEAEQLISSRRSSLHSSEPVLQSIRKTATKKRTTRVYSGEF